MRADDQPVEVVKLGDTPSIVLTGRWRSVRSKLIAGVGILVLLVAAYAVIDLGVMRSEMTSYSAICHDHVTEAGRCARITVLEDPQSFRVWPDQQRVVIRTGGAVHRGDCIVFDRTHWKCEMQSGNTVGSAAGRIYRSLREPSILEVRRVELSRWRYLALKWMGCGGDASDSRRCAWLAP
jgi:hypothetical protein